MQSYVLPIIECIVFILSDEKITQYHQFFITIKDLQTKL